jgi:hypothetical protein
VGIALEYDFVTTQGYLVGRVHMFTIHSSSALVVKSSRNF